MVFHDPSDRHETEGRRRMCLARCEALPGDTVWIDPVRRRVLPWRTTTDAQPLRVPTAGSRIRVTPVNARLLWNTMRIHEQCRVVLLNDTALRFDGQRLKYAFFPSPTTGPSRPTDMIPDNSVLYPTRPLLAAPCAPAIPLTPHSRSSGGCAVHVFPAA